MEDRVQRVRGTYAVIMGLTLSVTLGFTSLAMEASWHRLGANQLHSAVDAGSVAGAIVLDGTELSIELAKERAQTLVEANLIHGRPVVLDPLGNDILAGRYDNYGENDCDLVEGCWSEKGTAYVGYSPSRTGTVGASDTNGIRVTVADSVSTIFSSVIGTDTLGLQQTATSRLPITPGVGCAFPLTMPQCAIDDWMLGDACDRTVRLRLSSAQVDTVSWSRPADGSSYDTLAAVADINGDSCTSNWSEADIDDGEADVELINGQMNTAFHILSAQLDASNYVTDVDGDGSSEILDYTNASVGWNYQLWGPDCPDTLTDALCDPATQGICDCPNGDAPCLAAADSTECAAESGSWLASCPTVAADCTNGVFLRRQVAVFDNPGVSCDANGNVDTQSSWNFNTGEDVSGFVTMIIYNIEKQGNDKFIDAHISCLTADGSSTADTDGDGQADAVHTGSDEVVEDARRGAVAVVK